MKKYELNVIFRPEFETEVNIMTEKVKKIVEDNGGKIVSEEQDGKKRLAYPIDGQDFGVYYFAVVELPAAAPAKIASVLNITDGVMRQLIVLEDERKMRYAAKQAARKQKEENKEEEK